jgi:hypothetical protein
MALRPFASVMMQLLPIGCAAERVSTTETTARAPMFVPEIACTLRVFPIGVTDNFLVSHVVVFWVISTTMQGGALQTIGRVSTDCAVQPALKPPAVWRHTFVVGIVNPL